MHLNTNIPRFTTIMSEDMSGTTHTLLFPKLLRHITDLGKNIGCDSSEKVSLAMLLVL